MKISISIAVLVVLAGTASWGQSAVGPVPPSRPVAATSNADGAAAAARFKMAADQHVQDMGATLTKMHAQLKNMQAKTPATSKDSVAKANLEMWSLMLDQLDKQYAELVASTKAREELLARRRSLYQQADAKAAAEARAAQQASPALVAPAAEGQPAVAPPAASTPTPAAPTSSPN